MHPIAAFPLRTPPAAGMSTASLARALGRRDLTAFAINSVIGAGIFGIPAVLYGRVGSASVAAMLLAAVVVALVTLCFAEVGSAFDGTGGPYLYAHHTFGPFVGFEVGWLMWVARHVVPARRNARRGPGARARGRGAAGERRPVAPPSRRRAERVSTGSGR